MNKKIKEVIGKIEQIEAGHGEMRFRDRRIFKATSDQLDINNGKMNAWIFSPITGYRQLGTFKVSRPHDFKEGQKVVVKIDEKDRIVGVRSFGETGGRKVIRIRPSPLDEEWRREVKKMIDGAEREIVIIEGG